MHDVTKHRYIASVLNPFTGPLSKGITGSALNPKSFVVRRRTIVNMSLTGGTATAGGGAGNDIVFALGYTVDPWILVANNVAPVTDWGASTTITKYGLSSSPALIADTLIRTVSAGIRIRSLAANQDVGGRMYFFSPAQGIAADMNSVGPSLLIGGVRSDLKENSGVASFKPGNAVEYIVPPQDVWRPAVANGQKWSFGTWAHTGTWDVSTAVQDAHVRAWYIGPPQDFEVEICQILEYYNDDHAHYMSPTVTHPAGAHIHATTQAVLATGAVVTHEGERQSLFKRILGGVDGFVHTAVNVAKGTAQATQAVGEAIYKGRAIQRMWAAGESVAEGALLLGAAA